MKNFKKKKINFYLVCFFFFRFESGLENGYFWINEIPQDYGSSYFDRFWTNGKRNQRYFLKYLKKEKE